MLDVDIVLGRKDMKGLIDEVIVSSVWYLEALTEALIDSGHLDPQAVLSRMHPPIWDENANSVLVEDAINFFMSDILQSSIDRENWVFARIKRLAAKNGLRVRRKKGVSPNGLLRKDYIVEDLG